MVANFAYIARVTQKSDEFLRAYKWSNSMGAELWGGGAVGGGSVWGRGHVGGAGRGEA